MHAVLFLFMDRKERVYAAQTLESSDCVALEGNELHVFILAKHSYVVLLSNDRNLCNKAVVSGIKAFSQQVCSKRILLK